MPTSLTFHTYGTSRVPVQGSPPDPQPHPSRYDRFQHILGQQHNEDRAYSPRHIARLAEFTEVTDAFAKEAFT